MIISHRPIFPSSDAAFYARRVVKELGLKDPPILPEPILDYFGLEYLEIDDQEEQRLLEVTGMAMETPAMLYKGGGRDIVIVKGTDIPERKRLSTFHECGHFGIPWHENVTYLCPCGDLDLSKVKRLEKEAFSYASHLIFPDRPFYDDFRSLPTCLNSIQILSQRYLASFEATAIRYIQSAPGLCAILYLKRNNEADSHEYPYIVRYSVISERFHHFWKKGDKILQHDILECCFGSGLSHKCEIPASIFGSQKKHNYIIETKRHGVSQICVFLLMPDNQFNLI